jgi:hypothetical protein
MSPLENAFLFAPDGGAIGHAGIPLAGTEG